MGDPNETLNHWTSFRKESSSSTFFFYYKMKNNEAILEWKQFFEKKGLQRHITDVYIEYITTLYGFNVPVIFDFKHLSLLLGRTQGYLASVVNSSENHYRDFSIPKRNGGTRLITAPFSSLLEIQHWIYTNILVKVRLHSSAHGFTYNKSIITNAKIHVGQKHLLKIDLKDFFPSISINRVINVFKKLGYTNQIAFYLAKICCYEGALPQGAPTSPYLSNIIAINLDRRLMALAKSLNLKYTRYADDITISGDEISGAIINYVENIITDEGFTLNKEKTRLYQNNGQRIVTGISVTENKLKLPREYKRNLRLELYHIETKGLQSHVSKKKIRRIDYLLSMIGKVNFWLQVEPENKYAQNALEVLKQYYTAIYR